MPDESRDPRPTPVVASGPPVGAAPSSPALARARRSWRLDRPLAVVREEERRVGGLRTSATVFLVGAECPFRCVFCDLGRFTIEGPTPRGALPRQLEVALESLSVHPDGLPTQIKLYNASNFFDERAVPEADEVELAERVSGFELVTVECHPRLVLSQRAFARCVRFADRLEGRLEVAMGLETARAQTLARLQKDADLETWSEACSRLREASLGIRAFVLLGVPFLPAGEQEKWGLRSVRLALDSGCDAVSLIPVRETPELLTLEQAGEWSRPTLDLVERCLERAVRELEPSANGVVLVDPWDLDALARESPCCGAQRVDRLLRLNRSGRVPASPAGCTCEGPAA